MIARWLTMGTGPDTEEPHDSQDLRQWLRAVPVSGTEGKVSERAVMHVLMALGDYADANGLCYPSIKSVSEYTRLSRRAVSYALDALVRDGFVTITHRSAGAHGQTSSQYRLNNKAHRVQDLHSGDVDKVVDQESQSANSDTQSANSDTQSANPCTRSTILSTKRSTSKDGSKNEPVNNSPTHIKQRIAKLRAELV